MAGVFLYASLAVLLFVQGFNGLNVCVDVDSLLETELSILMESYRDSRWLVG
jgi:hypothetical protein